MINWQYNKEPIINVFISFQNLNHRNSKLVIAEYLQCEKRDDNFLIQHLYKNKLVRSALYTREKLNRSTDSGSSFYALSTNAAKKAT